MLTGKIKSIEEVTAFMKVGIWLGLACSCIHRNQHKGTTGYEKKVLYSATKPPKEKSAFSVADKLYLHGLPTC